MIGSIKTFVASVVACACLSSVTQADDTEIFFSQTLTSEQKASNILFMFDVSGSMGSDDGSGDARINSVKKAMLEIVDSGSNVRIGIGSFNGLNQGGNIHVPMIGIEEDRCPGNACGIVEVRGTIHSAMDDARETAAGAMVTDEEIMSLGQSVDAATVTTEWYKEVIGENDAIEYPDGTFSVSDTTLRMFGNDPLNVPSIGVRFGNVTIPPGSDVQSAGISFYSSGAANNAGYQNARIRVDTTTDSPVFADVPGQRVTDRPTLLTSETNWWGIYAQTTEDDARYSVDLSGMVQERIDLPDWKSGDPLTMIIDSLEPWNVGTDNELSWKSYENGSDTRLKVEYTTAPVTPQAVGLRYTDLNIPRGATITSATLDFFSTSTNTKDTTLTISAQDIGDAPPFTATVGDLSTRTKTAGVNWTVDDWLDNKQWYSSADVSSVVQAVVNRSDWCGGNSLAMFVDGIGKRAFYTYEDSPFNAPILKVNYEASSIAYGTSCVRKRSVTQLNTAVNDAVEDSSGALVVDGAKLATHSATTGNLIGLRFENVSVPEGATVTSAQLRMKSAADTTDRPSVLINGELAAYSATFDTSIVNSLSSRTRTVENANWIDIDDADAGEFMRSADIGDIVEEIVGMTGWVSGNPVTLLIAGDSVDTGVREFESHDAGGEISLVVNYALDGPEFAADKVSLITGREDIINTVLDFRPLSSTPLVDAYYEAAAYMTGSDVDFGTTRGGGSDEESRFRVSAPDTYTGGTVIRPAGCTDVNLGDEVCAGEVIDGTATYTQIDPGECQANQIVLLTDGAATTSSSESRIQSMIGTGSCAARSNDDEICGLELGEWLKDNDHFLSIDGVQPVVTHTVGFSFSSSFLEELATVGGGGFHEADSSSELVDAFTKIIESAAETTTSFVPPAVAINQSNRLTNSNDLYFGLFQPENTVRWDGNLKKYSLAKDAVDTSKIIIVDGDGNPAFDDTSGAFVDTARSYWSVGADGSNVAAGGAASLMASTRNVLTFVDPGATPEPLIDLDETDNSLTADLFNIDATQTDYLSDVIKWGRGVDIKDHDGDGDTSEIRLQMGDPLHSSPVIINYASKSVLFVGTNEGFLHGIDTADGTEEFAFIPKELLGNLTQYFENPVDKNRPYGLDGPITSWINDTNGNGTVDTGESAFVVVGMRRGGRNYYALDVSNPASPKLAWVIKGGSGDFAELGQSWSRPIKTRVRVGTTDKEVLIFAAGYDTSNDSKTVRDPNDTMGRGIFIVDATTGARLAYEAPITNTDLQYSIPSDIRAVDINLDSYIDYLFVGDTGGQIWRFDINNDNAGSLDTALTGGVIADFGGTDGDNYRRFFYEPDVALINGGGVGEYLNIAIGSGVRAHPLDTAAKDRLYVIRDRAVFGPPVDADGAISYPTTLTEANLFDATTASGSTDTSGKIYNGWLIKLADPGEKVLSRATTINGQVLFTTYLPASGSVGTCGISVGNGRVYAVDGRYADPVADLDGDGEAVLTLTDRFKNLRADGIPTHVTALIPEVSPDSPVAVVGAEVLPDIDFGDLFKRTFWAEN